MPLPPALNGPRDFVTSFRLRLTLLLLWGAAVGFLSLAPGVEAPAGLPFWDKFNHFFAYAVLALLLIRTLTARYALSDRALRAAWLIATGYGLLLEALQGLQGLGRQCEWGDLLANALGALAVCAVFRHGAVRIPKSDDEH